MEMMSEELAASMLRTFMLARLDLQARWEERLKEREGKPPTWQWAPGTFVFPEGLCCYCGAVMQSDVLWRAENLQFLGSWKVIDGEGGVGWFSYDATHPHVNAGSICMGGGSYRATSLSDALFTGLNPISSYFFALDDPETGEIVSTNERIKAWLADRFDHVCGKGPAVASIGGVDNSHAVAPEADCHCPHCRAYRNEVQCPRSECGQWYAPRTGHGRFLCKSCSASGMQRYCYKHKHEFYSCVSCGDRHDRLEVATGNYTSAHISRCTGCEEWVCSYCLSNRRHRCGSSGVEIEEAPVTACTHECCVDHCRANGCNDLELYWPDAFEDYDEDDEPDEEF